MKKHICLLLVVLMIGTLGACNYAVDEHNHSHDHTHASETVGDAGETAAQGGHNGVYDSDVSSTDALGESDMTDEDTTYSTQGDADNQQTTDYPFTVEASGELMQKHSNKIDIPFEQELTKAQTQKAKASVCVIYTEKWKTVAERYYKEILYYNGSVPEDPNFTTDEEMHAYIEQRKTQWDAEFEENSKNYLASMEQQYPDSDKAQAMCESYKFDLQREFALELIGIYEMLGEFNNQEF